MQSVGFVSTDRVIEAFRGDSKVLEVTAQWPDTPFMRIVVLRVAQRPVDRILRLVWRLCILSQTRFRQCEFASHCSAKT